MLLDKGINELMATSVVAIIDRVVVIVEMNTCMLSCLIPLDIEDSIVTLSNTLGRLLANPTHES